MYNQYKKKDETVSLESEFVYKKIIDILLYKYGYDSKIKFKLMEKTKKINPRNETEWIDLILEFTKEFDPKMEIKMAGSSQNKREEQKRAIERANQIIDLIPPRDLNYINSYLDFGCGDASITYQIGYQLKIKKETYMVSISVIPSIIQLNIIKISLIIKLYLSILIL